MKQSITIKLDSEDAKKRAHGVLEEILCDGSKCVEFKAETRTIDQNKAQWPILSSISAQRKWPIDGEMMLIDPDSWKDILTAAYRKEVPRVAKAFSLGTQNNYDAGSVMIGQRTSKFKRGEFPEWLEYLNAAAAELGVKVPMSKKQAAMYE